jgi:hypothetical protein
VSGNARIENREFAAPAIVAVLQQRALLVGVVFAIAAVAGFVVDPQQAMHSYLLAFMFCLGPTLGAMSLLMTWHLTGGDWGVGVRRIWEAAVGTLPMMVAAFVPLAFGAYRHMNYPWANPEELKRSEHLAHQAARYLNPNLFLGRGILFFLAWSAIAYFLLAWSAAQDHPPKHAPDKRFQALSAVGIIVYGWTLTFAVVDWVMSLAPEFTSTIYGLIFMVGQALLALCLAVIAAHLLKSHEPMAKVLTVSNFHDYGKLTLTFVMLWAYFSFSQWLIVWSGNLPEEIHWFADRIRGDWRAVGVALIVGHFAIPFAMLLSRGLKQNSRKLMWIAAWLIAMRYLDLYWNIAPNFSPAKLHYSWLDAVVPIAMSAFWLAYFLRNLKGRPLVALHDPNLTELLAKQHE